MVNLLDAMKERNNLDTDLVEDMILATGEPVNEQGQNIAKTALVYADWSVTQRVRNYTVTVQVVLRLVISLRLKLKLDLKI